MRMRRALGAAVSLLMLTACGRAEPARPDDMPILQAYYYKPAGVARLLYIDEDSICDGTSFTARWYRPDGEETLLQVGYSYDFSDADDISQYNAKVAEFKADYLPLAVPPVELNWKQGYKKAIADWEKKFSAFAPGGFAKSASRQIGETLKNFNADEDTYLNVVFIDLNGNGEPELLVQYGCEPVREAYALRDGAAVRFDWPEMRDFPCGYVKQGNGAITWYAEESNAYPDYSLWSVTFDLAKGLQWEHLKRVAAQMPAGQVYEDYTLDQNGNYPARYDEPLPGYQALDALSEGFYARYISVIDDADRATQLEYLLREWRAD